ncbi:unnamed protein product [Boreogadus saida]
MRSQESSYSSQGVTSAKTTHTPHTHTEGILTILPVMLKKVEILCTTCIDTHRPALKGALGQILFGFIYGYMKLQTYTLYTQIKDLRCASVDYGMCLYESFVL